MAEVTIAQTPTDADIALSTENSTPAIRKMVTTKEIQGEHILEENDQEFAQSQSNTASNQQQKKKGFGGFEDDMEADMQSGKDENQDEDEDEVLSTLLGTDDSMEEETKLDEVLHHIGKCETKCFRVGEKFHTLKIDEPIFILARPTKKLFKNHDCLSCENYVFKPDEEINYCDFCGNGCCPTCMTKTRTFPKARPQKPAPGAKKEKGKKEKPVLARGPICKLCDRKFLAKRLFMESIEKTAELDMKEMAFQIGLEEEAKKMMRISCSTNIKKRFIREQTESIKETLDYQSTRNTGLYIMKERLFQTYPELARWVIGKVDEKHHNQEQLWELQEEANVEKARKEFQNLTPESEGYYASKQNYEQLKQALDKWKDGKDDREMKQAQILLECQKAYKETSESINTDEIKKKVGKKKKQTDLELIFTPAASTNRSQFKFKAARTIKPLGLQLKINNPNDVAAKPKPNVQIIERESENSSDEESSLEMLPNNDGDHDMIYQEASLTPKISNQKLMSPVVKEALATTKAKTPTVVCKN